MGHDMKVLIWSLFMAVLFIVELHHLSDALLRKDRLASCAWASSFIGSILLDMVMLGLI